MIIAILLAFNAALGYFQEGRAQATLAALKSRLALNASVLRDNVWATVPAAGLVPDPYPLGVHTVMVTGDAPATAEIVARAVGLEGKVCPPGPIPESVRTEDFAVFAGVLPEGKYDLDSVTKKSVQVLFLAVGLLMTGQAI